MPLVPGAAEIAFRACTEFTSSHVESAFLAHPGAMIPSWLHGRPTELRLYDSILLRRTGVRHQRL
jgi:hypothetical protein